MNTRYFNTSPDIIRWAILLYIRYPLSLRQVEELLAERGMDISHESVRRWWNRFGPEMARNLKAQRSSPSRWVWHIDEVFVRINGVQHYLWRAVDHEGEVIECVVTKKRDRHAAKALLRKLIKRNGSPNRMVTDKLGSYRAALSGLGYTGVYDTTRWSNNRVENFHQPFRRRERSMQRFRSVGSLQKFVAIHSQVHNHFNHERHLTRCKEYKIARTRLILGWQESCA